MWECSGSHRPWRRCSRRPAAPSAKLLHGRGNQVKAMPKHRSLGAKEQRNDAMAEYPLPVAMADRREGNAPPYLTVGRTNVGTTPIESSLSELVVCTVNWKTVEYVRPIAGAAHADLWRPATAKIQLDTPPMYHRDSCRLGTKLSFHSTTKHARYTESGQRIGWLWCSSAGR